MSGIQFIFVTTGRAKISKGMSRLFSESVILQQIQDQSTLLSYAINTVTAYLRYILLLQFVQIKHSFNMWIYSELEIFSAWCSAICLVVQANLIYEISVSHVFLYLHQVVIIFIVIIIIAQLLFNKSVEFGDGHFNSNTFLG